MTAIATALVKGALLTATPSAPLYTSPVNTRTVIKAATLSNTTAGSISAQVWLVNVGSNANDQTRVIAATAVAAGAAYTCPELINHVLEAGGQIFAIGAGLGFTVSGVELG